MLKDFVYNLIRSKPPEEAFWAYFNRLPDSIYVRWFRDRDFIIGEVIIDDKKYFTQAKDPDDFINMVNSLVLTVCDIPVKYSNFMQNCRSYVPSTQELEKLQQASVKNSTIGFRKRKKDCLQYA